jgi:hypothetical protein
MDAQLTIDEAAASLGLLAALRGRRGRDAARSLADLHRKQPHAAARRGGARPLVDRKTRIFSLLTCPEYGGGRSGDRLTVSSGCPIWSLFARDGGYMLLTIWSRSSEHPGLHPGCGGLYGAAQRPRPDARRRRCDDASRLPSLAHHGRDRGSHLAAHQLADWTARSLRRTAQVARPRTSHVGRPEDDAYPSQQPTDCAAQSAEPTPTERLEAAAH